jgi:hypothetical protein
VTTLRLRCFTVLVAIAATASGCGGDEPSGRSLLRDDTAAVVKAFNAKDYAGARRALLVLESDIAAASRLKQLTADEVTALTSRVTKLRSDLALVTPKPSPTPSPTRSPVRPRVDPPKGDDDDEKGKGKGKGNDD